MPLIFAHPFLPPSRYQRSISDSLSPEHSPVPLDLSRRPQHLRIIIGELNRRPPFHARNLADQADRIKASAIVRIASAKIIGQQRSPTGAHPDASFRRPLTRIVEISR